MVELAASPSASAIATFDVSARRTDEDDKITLMAEIPIDALAPTDAAGHRHVEVADVDGARPGARLDRSPETLDLD